MVATLTSVKISAIFVISLISFLGFKLPEFLGREIRQSSYWKVCKSLSAGVILGVAIMHLMVDGIDTLQSYSTYPLPFVLVLTGTVVTLGIEQWALHAMLHVNHQHCNHSHEHSHEVELKDRECHVLDKDSMDETKGLSCGESNHCDIESKASSMQDHVSYSHSHCDHDHYPSSSSGHSCHADTVLCHHSHPHCEVIDSDSGKALTKAIIMEVSISVHSIIIGFDMGTLSTMGELQALFIAMIFHQFFEGLGLGTSMHGTSINNLSKNIFSLVFAFSFAVGILIGLGATAGASSSTADAVKGVANCFACGSLLYVGLVEMIAEDFSDPSLNETPFVKFQMYLGLIFGAGFLALLAYWA